MASGGLGNLTVDLLLETMQWVSGLNKAEQQAKQFADAIGDKFDAMGERALSALKGMAAGVAAGFAVEKIAGFVNETQKAADALDEMAQKTGTSVQFLAGMSVAAEMSGSSVDGVAKSFGKFSEQVTKAFADPTSNPAVIFKELGISVTDSAGQLKSSEAIYQEVAIALGTMEDGAIKTAAAKKLLGKSGAELIPTFNQLARQSEELTEATNKYKDAMTQLAPIAGQLEEQQTIMATNQKAMAATIGTQLIPYFTTLIQQWNEATSSGSALGTIGTHLLNAFKGIVIAIDAVITTFSNLITLVAGGVKIFERLKVGDLTGAGAEWNAMQKELADSSAAFDKRMGALLGTLDATTTSATTLTKAGKGLAAAVAEGKDGAKAAAKEWEALSKQWVKSIDDAIEADKKLALAGAKAIADRERALEKETQARLDAMTKAATEEQKIMEEAYKLGAKFRADEQAKQMQEWKAQYGDFYRAIESAGEQAFFTLFDGTKDGWDEMLKSMTGSFKKILLQQIYNAFVKPFILKMAAQVSGMPGAGGAGVGGGGGVGGLGDYAQQAYNYYNQNWGAGSYAEGGANFMGPMPEGYVAGAGTGGLGQLSWTSNAGGAWGAAGGMAAGYLGGAFGGWAAGAYGAGERGQENATNYAATGAAIGMQVYGPIGAIVGAVIGTIVGISTDPDPDAMRKAVFGQITEHTQGVTKWQGNSAFGKFGFSEGEWLSDEQMDESMQRAISGIAAMDNALAGFMSDEQIERVKANLADAAKKYELGMEHLDVVGIGAIIKDRLAIITAEFHEGLSQFVAAFEGDAGELTTIVASFMQARTGAEGFDVQGIIDAQKPLGLEEGYTKLRGGLEEYIAGLDTSAESMQGLVSGMEQFQIATVQMVMAIDAITQSIHGMFMNTADSIKRSVMTKEEEYNYLQKQTDDLYAQLATETDPAEIARISEQINQNILDAWALLTPEQQQAMADSFTTRLEALDEYVATKLGALREVVIEDAETIMESITTRLDALFVKAEKAADTNQEAADTNLEAAQTPVVVVVMDANGNTVGAAG